MKGKAEDKKLLAYIVAKNSSDAVDIEAKRRLVALSSETLSKSLPNYMIPSAFVVIEKFPLTHNGKIDRLKLPDPDESSVKKSRYVAPRNLTESLLCAIWQETLNLEKIGIEDNFFELGGHSIMALQLIANIQEHFNKALAIESVL